MTVSDGGAPRATASSASPPRLPAPGHRRRTRGDSPGAQARVKGRRSSASSGRQHNLHGLPDDQTMLTIRSSPP